MWYKLFNDKQVHKVICDDLFVIVGSDVMSTEKMDICCSKGANSPSFSSAKMLALI